MIEDDNILALARGIGFRPFICTWVFAVDKLIRIPEFQIPDTALDRVSTVVASAV